MRFWENNGEPLQDGRYCYVIDPEDGTNPIKTYGRTHEEVLEKVAKTAETAQQLITRQRQGTAGGGSTAQPPSTAAPSNAPAVTSEELMQAAVDINNPAKAPAAVATMLRAQGFDVTQERVNREAVQAGKIAEQWEVNHPEFPRDPRNQRILMDKALIKAGGRLGNITAKILEDAYTDMLQLGMLFENSEPIRPPDNPPMPPDGNQAPVSRPRPATGMRRTLLSGNPPVPKPPTPKYTREDIRKMDSAVLAEKIRTESGFAEVVETLSRPVSA